MKATDLDQYTLNNFSILERFAAILSLLGTLFIISTYLSSRIFQKPINRLVFIASLGNVMGSLAALIARSAVQTGYYTTFLCQFQAFLIQMFFPADALWTFAMALNVYLTFYHGFDEVQLRRLEKYYVMGCYGVPFILAIAFTFASTALKGRMYGNATLWCWIDSDWDIWRIAAFYAPVWVVIFATFSIYIRAGKDIYVKRKQLRAMSVHVYRHNPAPFTGLSSIKTTEVFVTSESTTTVTSPVSQSSQPGPRRPKSTAESGNGYSCNVTVGPTPQDHYNNLEKGSSGVILSDTPSSKSLAPLAPQIQPQTVPHRPSEAMRANSAILAYCKVAGLFFAAMLCTWIPSSANRLYSLVHPSDVCLPLEYASALVLPLQGFWNAVIYAITCKEGCKHVWATITELSSRKEVKTVDEPRRPDTGHSYSSTVDDGYGGARHGRISQESDSPTIPLHEFNKK